MRDASAVSSPLLTLRAHPSPPSSATSSADAPSEFPPKLVDRLARLMRAQTFGSDAEIGGEDRVLATIPAIRALWTLRAMTVLRGLRERGYEVQHRHECPE